MQSAGGGIILQSQIVQKEIHIRPGAVYIEGVFFLAAAGHSAMLVKSVVAAGICKQVEFAELLLPHIIHGGIKQELACAFSLICTVNGEESQLGIVVFAAVAQKLFVDAADAFEYPGDSSAFLRQKKSGYGHDLPETVTEGAFMDPDVLCQNDSRNISVDNGHTGKGVVGQTAAEKYTS